MKTLREPFKVEKPHESEFGEKYFEFLKGKKYFFTKFKLMSEAQKNSLRQDTFFFTLKGSLLVMIFWVGSYCFQLHKSLSILANKNIQKVEFSIRNVLFVVLVALKALVW